MRAVLVKRALDGWFAGVKAAPPIEVSITVYLLIKNDSMFIE